MKKKTLKQKTLNAVLIPMVSMNLSANQPITTIQVMRETLQKNDENFLYKRQLMVEKEKQRKYVDSEYERMDATGIDFEDIRKTSNVNLDEIKHLLSDTELQDCSQYYLDAEEEYGVNALVLISITALESGWGTSRLAKLKNNLSGFMAYNIETFENAKTFSSKKESIMMTAQLLSESYLTEGARYYRGTSIENVNNHYCTLDDGKTPDREWAKAVRKIGKGLIKELKQHQEEVGVNLATTL